MLGSTVGEREPGPVPGPDREPPDELVRRILGELVLAPHEQRVVAADRAVEAVAVATDPRPDLAVVEARGDPEVDLDRPADSLEDAHDPPGVGADRVVAHDEAVEQPGLAGGAVERGLEHERVVEVRARVLPRAFAGRRDRAVPAVLPTEQAAERAAGVESR